MAVRVYKGGEYRRWDLLGLSCFCGWVYASFFTKAISLKGPLEPWCSTAFGWHLSSP